MPRTPIDFSKTIIYKIVHKEDPDNHESYVGHTTDFTNRKRGHKKTCNNQNDRHHLKVYQYIRENGGWDDFIMLEIEKYPCNDANEARAREQEWYTELKSKLNKICPKRNKKEWYEDNRDNCLEQMKQYRQDNRDKISEQRKQYRQDNRDTISEQKKQNYQDNRDKILEQRKQKINCEICGFIGSIHHLKRHQKTTKCMEAKK